MRLSAKIQFTALAVVVTALVLIVELSATGSETLSLVFIFPQPDGMAGQMRSGSAGEGERPLPFTAEELAARNARASERIVFDEPITP
jgi:hypothetical protein